ncbi:MAG: hypothetical protein MO846_12615, partial [Candidatus Devosia symbiotica]|nr:hypothetical protein [Candidatus Devosia symbiotica]
MAKLALVRAKLEGNITANIQLVRELVSIISAELAKTTPERFQALASHLFDETSQLHSVAVAPDL